MVGMVVSYKGYKEKDTEKKTDIEKKEFEKEIELTRINDYYKYLYKYCKYKDK